MSARVARVLVLAALSVATGIVLAVSLRGNFLYGYSLGQSDEKRLLFGWANVGADLWKAFGLIAVGVLWHSDRRRVALGAFLTWCMCLMFGINSALGIYMQDRATLVSFKEASHLSLRDAQIELDVVNNKLHSRSLSRTTSEIDAEIATIFARPVTIDGNLRGTVGAISKRCAMVGAATRAACRDVLRLQQERAAAMEHEKLEARAAELRVRVSALREGGALQSPDPVADFYAWISRGILKARDVGFGFPLFFAMLVEAVSAFGPVTIAAYAAASRAEARSGAAMRAVASHDTPRLAMASRRALEPDILAWMAERATPVGSAHAISLDELHADYVSWCGEIMPISVTAFEREIDRARELPELAGKIRKFKQRYYGIGLTRKKLAGAAE